VLHDFRNRLYYLSRKRIVRDGVETFRDANPRKRPTKNRKHLETARFTSRFLVALFSERFETVPRRLGIVVYVPSSGIFVNQPVLVLEAHPDVVEIGAAFDAYALCAC
jgi:hypothetical protein